MMPYKDRDKQKLAQHKSYLRNKAKVYQRHDARRKEFRLWVDSLKDGKPCMDCGGVFACCAMHWDHRDEQEKTVNVSILRDTLNKQAVLDEIAKCDLVCANCHAVRTHERSQYFGRKSASIPTVEEQR